MQERLSASASLTVRALPAARSSLADLPLGPGGREVRGAEGHVRGGHGHDAVPLGVEAPRGAEELGVGRLLRRILSTTAK